MAAPATSYTTATTALSSEYSVPASDYLLPFLRLLSTLKFWRKRVAIVASRTPFARDVATGFERACRRRQAWRRGVRVRLKYTAAGRDRVWDRLLPRAQTLADQRAVAAGSFDEDVRADARGDVAGLAYPGALLCRGGRHRFRRGAGRACRRYRRAERMGGSGRDHSGDRADAAGIRAPDARGCAVGPY